MSDEEDFALLQEWQGGDAVAGNRLVRRHFSSVFRFFRTKLGDGVEDLTQQTFLGLVEARERYRGTGTFKAFLFGIARRQLLLLLRKKGRASNVFSPAEASLSQVAGDSLLGPARAVAQREDLPPIPQLRAAGETLSSVRDNDVTNHPRRHHLQPSRDQGSGVTVDETDDDALVLMAGFFDEENQIRLVERDGTVVRSWSLDYFEHFPDEGTRTCTRNSPLGVDTHGAHVTPDGEVVFNYEYCGTVKLDQCGEPTGR